MLVVLLLMEVVVVVVVADEWVADASPPPLPLTLLSKALSSKLSESQSSSTRRGVKVG